MSCITETVKTQVDAREAVVRESRDHTPTTDGVPTGRTRATQADVAAKVGVSRTLVSLVLRNQPGAGEETRNQILQAAAELGYRPDSAAQLLARSRSQALGVMLTLHNPFHADLGESIYSVAEQFGYGVILSARAPGRSEHSVVDALISHRCEALILLGPDPDAAYLSDVARQLPVVVVGPRVRGAGVDLVHTAEAKGVRQAVDHLAALGHRRIVHVDGGTRPGSSERRRGYRDAMRRKNLGQYVRVLPGDHTEESGIKAAQTLLCKPTLPTAVLAGNDRCAVGLLDALIRAGVNVPSDVSVVGYDDSPIARFAHIDLTTVRQDAPRMAELSVRAALQRLNHAGNPPAEEVLAPELVIRGTTAPPRTE